MNSTNEPQQQPQPHDNASSSEQQSQLNQQSLSSGATDATTNNIPTDLEKQDTGMSPSQIILCMIGLMVVMFFILFTSTGNTIPVFMLAITVAIIVSLLVLFSVNDHSNSPTFHFFFNVIKYLLITFGVIALVGLGLCAFMLAV